eukprot:14469909-Heterocapsa_arctica.AAC.1
MMFRVSPFAFVTVKQYDTLFVQNELIAINRLHVRTITVNLGLKLEDFAPKDDLLECSPLCSVHGSLFEIGNLSFVNIMLHVGAP